MAEPKHLWYPDNLQSETEHPATLQFKFFERKDVTSSSPLDTIDLYMPEQTSNPSTLHWSQESFGFVGNALAGAARAADGSFSSGQGLITAGMTGARTAAAEAAGIGDLIATRFLANAGSAAAGLMGGNVSAEGLMGEVMGKIPNPYLTAVFKGIDFRSFAFTFKFYPFREKDCDTIHDIIKLFRAHSLPHYKSDDTFLGYPSECQITYKWRGKDNKYLHKFKRAVCTAIDVDYTPNGMFSVTRNGFPTDITMSTKWTELEIVTRPDIEEGY